MDPTTGPYTSGTPGTRIMILFHAINQMDNGGGIIVSMLQLTVVHGKNVVQHLLPFTK